jgi:dual specificity phosphatase 12
MMPAQESEFVLKLILLRDSSTENLLQVLGEACEFIKSSLAKDDGGVLIHCHQGISRSASVVIAFVMEEMDLEYDTALRYVRGARAKVNPNKGFVVQLEMWRRLQYNIREENGDLKQEYADFKAAKEAQDAKNEATKW